MAERRILIMEDNADLRRLYAKALSKSGYQVFSAATLGETRALLAETHIDVFLCDIHVGNERGTDLLREEVPTLDRNGTKVIVISGEAQYRPFCEEMGIDFYLEKPVALGTLLTLVERLTAGPSSSS